MFFIFLGGVSFLVKKEFFYREVFLRSVFLYVFCNIEVIF